jgi:ankyrin repeat protein
LDQKLWDAVQQQHKCGEVPGLLNAGANPNITRFPADATPLFDAIAYGKGNNTECVRALVADPRTDVNAKLNTGVTPLQFAASYKDSGAIMELLKAPNLQKNYNGIHGWGDQYKNKTALEIAQFQGCQSCVDALSQI